MRTTAHRQPRAAGACFLLACLLGGLLSGEEGAKPTLEQLAPDAPGEWQKFETRVVPLSQPRQVMTPGLFDTDPQKLIVFPKDGSPADTGLPHGGKNKDGKEYPALMARVQQSFVWVDLNGDGKPTSEETQPVRPDGLSGPFGCELHYEDGTSGQYSFFLRVVVEREKFALVRCAARAFEFQGQKVVLLDDSGNGRYDDAGQDVVIAGNGAPCFLGKYLKLGEKFYEVLVHAAGATVELRAAGKLETGTVDLFGKYKPPQKAENLKIHTVIINGPQGSFAFDDRQRSGVVPAGAYDLASGLFERAKEIVYMKKGERTSFTLAAGQTVAPAWGGVIKAKFEVTSEEKGITVSAPQFFGAATEQYFPEHFRIVPVTVSIAQVFTDRMKLERRTPFGSKRYDVLPSGELSPVVFKPYRSSPDEYEISVDYNSGIMGSVTGKQRLDYVPQKKKSTSK